MGTTTESILFKDGVEFSTVNASGTPLLRMNVPVGQQKGNVVQVTHILPQPLIIEATSWVRNLKGEVELIAQIPSSLPQQATCSATNK